MRSQRPAASKTGLLFVALVALGLALTAYSSTMLVHAGRGGGAGCRRGRGRPPRRSAAPRRAPPATASSRPRSRARHAPRPSPPTRSQSPRRAPSNSPRSRPAPPSKGLRRLTRSRRPTRARRTRTRLRRRRTWLRRRRRRAKWWRRARPRRARRRRAEAVALHETEAAALREAEAAALRAKMASDVAAVRQILRSPADVDAAAASAAAPPLAAPAAALVVCYSHEGHVGGGRVCVEPELQYTKPTKVFWAPPDAANKGWRFQHLFRMGLDQHPAVEQTDSMKESALIMYLPTSTHVPPFAALGASPSKVVVVHESDNAGYYPLVSKDYYLIYLKRSWVTKADGAYTGTGRRYARDYYPIAYSVSDQYFDAGKMASVERTLAVVCSNRPTAKQPTRSRVVSWVAKYLDEHKALRGVAGEVNHAGRREINDKYFDTMRAARIVVTCNPSHWEGDFRTFEALASGALVFVDEMYAPHPKPFKDGVHVIVYDNSDEEAFAAKLDYYVHHPKEAQLIAAQGLRHALRYHRAVSRMDFILRSAHEVTLLNAGTPQSLIPYTHTARQIVMDVNATTQTFPIVDIASAAMNREHVDAKLNVGRAKHPPRMSDKARDELNKHNLLLRRDAEEAQSVVHGRAPPALGRRRRRR